tara:strand:+ start:83 stop:487 length:405 start_codon:yes stop_codon:yes gene_type:complete
MLILTSCDEILEDETCSSDCRINIYSDLPLDSSGVYQLTWNPSLVTTYSHLYVETQCGLNTNVQWDSDYQYEIVEGQSTSLINPASMTDEYGNGTIVYGVWEEFIGYTVTFYGGYTDHCDNHFVDSVRVKVNNN